MIVRHSSCIKRDSLEVKAIVCVYSEAQTLKTTIVLVTVGYNNNKEMWFYLHKRETITLQL